MFKALQNVIFCFFPDVIEHPVSLCFYCHEFKIKAVAYIPPHWYLTTLTKQGICTFEYFMPLATLTNFTALLSDVVFPEM